MQRVFVLHQQKRPLMPCQPARARHLLRKKRAAVYHYAPFTIILHGARPEAVVRPLRLKIDPGSVTTGLAILDETSHEGRAEVVWAAELTHQGNAIAGESHREYSLLGATTPPVVSDPGAEPGTGEIRYPTDAKRRDLRR
jgi:hypothetical protein